MLNVFVFPIQHDADSDSISESYGHELRFLTRHFVRIARAAFDKILRSPSCPSTVIVDDCVIFNDRGQRYAKTSFYSFTRTEMDEILGLVDSRLDVGIDRALELLKSTYPPDTVGETARPPKP